MTNENKPTRWVVSLGGGEWGTVKYGVVEYLRRHPKMRVATAVTGLLWVAGWIVSTAGFKWQIAALPAVSTFFVTPTLLWFAVVSGPEFSLAFEQPKTPNPPVPEPSAVLDPEGYGLEALNKSYVSTESYGRSSFRWAMFALVAGIVAACGNVWLTSSGIVSLGHGSLLISILVAALFLLCAILLFRSVVVFRRATVIHDKLLDLQKTITAMKFMERSHETPASIDPALVIAKLLTPSRSPNDSD